MKRLYRLLPALILLTLYSCGDSAIFLSPVDEPAEVQIDTVAAGSILFPGSEVPLRVNRDPVFTGDPESADRLIVELLDPDGVLLGEQIYESVDQADDLPPLLLPDLGEGLFVLRTSYLDGDEVVITEEVPFFISAGEYAIRGLSSFPATLYPGSAGLLSLNLDTPPGSDPFLRWFLDDELIQTGTLSETGTNREIQVPGDVGAYTVRVELYPSEPVLGEAAVPAAVSYTTELLVSTESLLDQSDLAPEHNYYALYHFPGNLRDTGARTTLFDTSFSGARTIGDPTLAVDSDIFGYLLDGNDGFEFDGLILPVRDDQLTPFSLSFRLKPSEDFFAGSVVTVESGNHTILQLDAGENGELVLSVGDGAATLISAGAVLDATSVSVITVTIVPVEGMTIVQFYVDGEAVLAETVDWDARTIEFPDPLAVTEEGWMALPGVARVAGEGGYAGIIDEFGLYFRDAGDQPSPDTEIFRSAMEVVHGEKLVYAEGFDANQLPDSVEIEGNAQVETGRLVLQSGAAALFPVFGFSSEELLVTVSLEALPGSNIRFYRGLGDDLIAELTASDPEESSDLQFQFTHTGSRLAVEWPNGEETRVELDTDQDFEGLRLEVSHATDEPAWIAVESVVAWRERPEIPAALFETRVEDQRDPARTEDRSTASEAAPDASATSESAVGESASVETATDDSEPDPQTADE